MIQQSSLFDRGARFVRGFLENDLPAAGSTGGDILWPVIQVKDIGMLMSRVFFHHFVQFGIRFHRAVLVGQDVTIKIAEKWKTSANMTNGQLVCIGEDIGGDAASPQFGMERHHWLDRHKNIAEKSAELFLVAAKA